MSPLEFANLKAKVILKSKFVQPIWFEWMILDIDYYLDFELLLKFAKTFDPYERTKFDMVVSFLMLLVVLYEPETAIVKKEPVLQTYS